MKICENERDWFEANLGDLGRFRRHLVLGKVGVSQWQLQVELGAGTAVPSE